MTKFYLPLDIETTGLNQAQDRILEISWVLCDASLKEVTPQRTFIVEHGHGWNEVWSLLRENTSVRDMHVASGLTHDLSARSAYVLSDIAEALISDLHDFKREDSTIHLVGKNVGFDREFLHNEFAFDGLWDSYVHHRVIDLDTFKLEWADLGIPFPEALNLHPHRAADDVQEALSIYRQIKDQLNNSDLREVVL